MNKLFIGLIMIAAFCVLTAGSVSSVTTFANEAAADKCALCDKPSDSHDGVIIVEKDGKHQTFCCQGCADKFEKEHHEDEGHDEGHHEHEGHDH
jgi:hypothetical protein